MELKRIALDTSKAVFTVHGIDRQDRPVLQRNFMRAAFEAFFAKLAPTEVALEACGGSHHWGRVLSAMGHQVRLIPPQYVKPFVKRGKNDRNDAEAICEAAGRPGMATVPVKSAGRQADAMIVGVRDLLVRQRTQLINAVRGHAAEFGVIAAKGTGQVAALMERVRSVEAGVPAAAQQERVGLVAAIAGASSAQARGGGFGQQDGPRGVGEAGKGSDRSASISWKASGGHDGAWGRVARPAGERAGGSRLTPGAVLREESSRR